MNSTVAVRVQDLIGPDMDATLVPSYHDILNDSFNFIAKVIPEASELWNFAELNKYTFNEPSDVLNINNQGSTTSSDNMRKVIRIEANYPTYSSHGEHINVMQIPWNDYISGANSNSIHYHGKSYNNPVWSLSPSGYVEVSPGVLADSGTTIQIYNYEYIDGTELADTTQLQENLDFPQEAVTAGCIKAAMNLLHVKLSDATQDEEDTELQNLLRTQFAHLEKELNLEMMRLIGNMPGIGDGTPE